jgi:hypothetical protein
VFAFDENRAHNPVIAKECLNPLHHMISRGKPLFLNLWVDVSLVHMSNVTYSKYTPTETWGNERYAVLAAVAAVGAVGSSTYRMKNKRRVKKSVLECVEQAGIKYATDHLQAARILQHPERRQYHNHIQLWIG